jgi:acetolactate synthase-1/2/3 large subunit
MAQMHIHSSPIRVFEQIETLAYQTAPVLARTIAAVTQEATASAKHPTLTLAFPLKPSSEILPFRVKPNFALEEPEKYFSEAVPIKPQRVMHDLPKMLPAGTRFVADGTSAYFWAIHYLHIPDRRASERRLATDQKLKTNRSEHNGNDLVHRRIDRRQVWESLYRCSGEFSGMGWGLGAGVGMAFGSPSMPTVVLTGDGSMLMNGQELTVALQHELTVIFIVLNDCGLGTVKHGQRLAGAERIGFEIPEVDFAAIARAMGIDGATIRSPADLQAIDFKEICRRRQPFLLDILIDPEEIPPIGHRMEALGIQH